MDRSKLDVAHLQKCDPAAWTALLRGLLDTEDVLVTAVTSEPLRVFPRDDEQDYVFRYILSLANHSDPVTLIGKHTNKTETLFFQNIAPQIPQIAPNCSFTSLSDDEGWIVIDDVPNHFPPHIWTPANVDDVIHGMADLHAFYWKQEQSLIDGGMNHFIGEKRYTWQELQTKEPVLFEEGPAASISDHAVNSAGQLAPQLVKAANGLAVIRDLGGWPGILGESHLTAAADLLDDPLPMLEPLRRLPVTLTHGNPYGYHWRLTLFGEMRLFGWQKTVISSGVCDLVNFLEQFDLLYDEKSGGMRMRLDRPLSEETMVDTYMLAMSSRLGSQFNARDARQAIPAARCLNVLLNWFPHFATWFSDMPNRYTWQKVNRMSDDQLMGTVFQPIVGFRSYMADVFSRFLRAYRTL